MIILETESDVVLHRRRSKLSNVLCFLNTLNLPSPCSAQDDGFPNMKRETSLCLIGTQHESFKGASLLCPGEVPMDAYSPGLNCGEPDSVTSTSWWTLEESSWQQVMEPEPWETTLQIWEETRVKQTPGDECVWTLHPSSALLHSQAQPLRNTVLFTEYRHTLLIGLSASPQNNSLLLWAQKAANKVG